MHIDGKNLTLERAAKAIYEQSKVTLSPSAQEQLQASRDVIVKCLAKDEPVYGINTGFGKLSEVRIPRDHLGELQENLVMSHACGVGPAVGKDDVRAILLLKANTLAKGFSGVRECIVAFLLSLLNHNILPAIPEKGSVGASGDLAPLAHLALAVIGQGEVFWQGKRMPASDALAEIKLEPVKLQAKEGLALLNGTQFMAGLGVVNWHLAKKLLLSADVISAMSTEALMGTPVAFDERIHAARGYRGQIETARRLRDMMQHSPIRDSHRKCSRVQDPYSIRCIPQVHGAILDNLRHVGGVLTTEMNAATDNPLVFSEQGEILSGGNFHGHPVATAMDLLAIVMAQMANISERRIALMMDANLSDLPAFLIKESGINSGFMIAHVTAASLVSENKILGHPASIDSIPTSANKEDYVTMGATASVKCRKILDNCLHVLAIELLCACQGLELRAPLQPGPASTSVLKTVRSKIPFLKKDRVLAKDLECAAELIHAGKILKAVENFIDMEI
jgi:histidine ammonia-lyase